MKNSGGRNDPHAPARDLTPTARDARGGAWPDGGWTENDARDRQAARNPIMPEVRSKTYLEMTDRSISKSSHI